MGGRNSEPFEGLSADSIGGDELEEDIFQGTVFTRLLTQLGNRALTDQLAFLNNRNAGAEPHDHFHHVRCKKNRRAVLRERVEHPTDRTH